MSEVCPICDAWKVDCLSGWCAECDRRLAAEVVGLATERSGMPSISRMVAVGMRVGAARAREHMATGIAFVLFNILDGVPVDKASSELPDGWAECEYLMKQLRAVEDLADAETAHAE